MKDNSKYQNLRVDYKSQGLQRESLSENPIDQLKSWLDEAINLKIKDSNAMNLSTLDNQGHIHSRIVLIKEIWEEGFVFYTNYRSHKAQQIENHSKVGINIFWRSLERQIRINANVEKISKKQSEEYFLSRPRPSRIAAWASKQSVYLEGKESLEKSFEYYSNKFQGVEIPLPEFWGGYLVKPYRYEFWQGAPSRMHDRFEYKLSDGRWDIGRLSP